jgi:FixJ family two-component response regulator
MSPGTGSGSAQRLTADPTVFVVDDDAGVRKSLRLLIETDGLAVETFASAAEFLASCTPERPGCLILDLRMPGMSGLELQEKLLAKGCHRPVIFITAHGDVATAARAFRAGALHFLEKPFSSHELLDTIHRALEKDARLREHEARRIEARTLLENLTRREREVCDQLVVGVPVKAIAANLKIAKKTCDVHRANLFRKMSVATTAELVWKYLLATGQDGDAAAQGQA